MEIRWTDEAEKQMQGIIDYYFEIANAQTAKRITEKINNCIFRLKSFPKMGHIEPGIEKATETYFSFVAHRHYKIVYRLEKEIVYITGIWDCRQNPERMTSETGK
ncbi:plasmid stabilization system protein ParE [Parabacteroides sp. PFB2-10]|uniref:type II toxin-antitoxin system RelE/ParE family toxin n=1 Tax=Parabacteroides sp. PFB2-10 TaxID=1742405 RepID=UPI002476C138|nr:type II toxin-antitoxin system RelE/ParE family toxin [Parabacteroides sp. PFB2-10]MDH6311960.1 plasmid stabilization system protein ParE [Parabacteroides sp. PFB2-10]